MTQSKQRAQHVGRHIPREPVLAVGRERLAGKGAGARVPTLKGTSSSPAQFPQFLPGTSPAEARLSPKETEWVELWGSKTSLDSRTERPTCRLAWPPTLSLSDKSYRVAVWARYPWRGKHFIKLKCFYNGGTETSAQCGIHGHHARFPLPEQ